MAASTAIRSSTNSMPLKERKFGPKGGTRRDDGVPIGLDGAGAGDKQTHSRRARNDGGFSLVEVAKVDDPNEI